MPSQDDKKPQLGLSAPPKLPYGPQAPMPAQAPSMLRDLFEGGVDVVMGGLGIGDETKANLVGQLVSAGLPLPQLLKMIKGGIGLRAAPLRQMEANLKRGFDSKSVPQLPQPEPFLPARHPRYQGPTEPSPREPLGGSYLPTRHPLNQPQKPPRIPGMDTQLPRPVSDVRMDELLGKLGGTQPQLTDLVHFSRTKGLTQLDPSFMGTGFPAEQVKRGGPQQSFFYLRDTPYEHEIAGMPYKYKTQADLAKFYDINADPQGFANPVGKFEQTPNGQVWVPPTPPMEAIQAAGFPGYHNGNIVGVFGPMPVQRDLGNDALEAVVKKYGGTGQSQAKINPMQGTVIADAYEQMPHAPRAPETQQAYDALVAEINSQLDDIKAAGFDIQPYGPHDQPYANSEQLFEDLKYNKRLKFYQGGDMPQDHPLAQRDEKTGLLYNDIFRAVHDALAHGAGGHSFGPIGETRAAAVHASTLSPQAQPALFSETIGQNSWVNFGPHMRVPNPPPQGMRPYAEQKAGLMDPQVLQLIQGILRSK